MKAKEMRVMSESDIENKIMEMQKELMKANSQIAVGTMPKSPGKVGEMKRTIAKLLTVKNENVKGIVRIRKKSENKNLEEIKGGSKKE